jgi:hypothetical protein
MKHILLATLLLIPAGLSAQPAGDPTGAASAFYAVYASQRAEGDGIPDATGRVRYTPVLSPRLNKQLAAASAAQARLNARVKNAVPPMLEGDIFSSLFEGATSWKIGACQVNAKTARCPVALTYTPAPSQRAAKPANWSDTVLLVETPQGWKVDDVIYDAGFAFGNTGRLSSMLQMVIAANP